MIISFHHFKLEKELNYQNTLGKEEELLKEYEQYLNTIFNYGWSYFDNK